MTRTWLKGVLGAAALVVALAVSGGPAALADTTVKVGKAMGSAFTFTPIDVGIATGIFKKHGIDVQKFNFGGSGKMQQALAAGAIDIGLGTGPEFAVLVKGAPDLGVGQLAGRPSLMGLLVPANSTLKTVADLKGRKIGISTTGSLTQWLVETLSAQQGWGPNGIQMVTLGANTAMIAAMRTGQIDGAVIEVATDYEMEQKGVGKLFVKFGDIVDHFVLHVIWAQKGFVQRDPGAVRSFLAAWYETISFMKANKDKTVEIATPVMGTSKEIAARAYDELMPIMNTDGHFDRQGLEVVAASFPELKLLPTKPDLTPYIDESYLPKK
ncbi:MAG TPA: ABC transporter substrate-binding protein [Stellaceae bacterium]|nr:ABC transporter substrate-binding protein [Stellaceae bacterium]